MSTLAHAVATALVAVVLASVAFNAAAYAAARRARRRLVDDCPLDDETPLPWPARALAWMRAFVVESAALAFVLATVPLGFRRLRIRQVDADGRRPVLLVHGYAQHTANFLTLARRLRRDGWLHLYTVRHTALWGDIERSGARLAAVVERIRRESGAADVDVVAHSMGGLVARACVRTLGDGGGIARIITLGTPHQGSEAFRRAGLDPLVRQMRPGSPLLRRLATDDPVPARVECTSIYSADDALVVPPGNAYYPGAFNIQVEGVGHLSLLFSRRVYELVRENLAAPVGAAAKTAGPTRA